MKYLAQALIFILSFATLPALGQTPANSDAALKAAQTPPVIMANANLVTDPVITGSVLWSNLTLTTLGTVTAGFSGTYAIQSETNVSINPNDQSSDGYSPCAPIFTGHIANFVINDNGENEFSSNVTMEQADLIQAFIFFSTNSNLLTTTQTAALSIDISQSGAALEIAADSLTATLTFSNGLCEFGQNVFISASSCTTTNSNAIASGATCNTGSFEIDYAGTQADVDTLLTNLASSSVNNTNITIGGTSATPGSSGITAIAILTGNSCTVTTN